MEHKPTQFFWDDTAPPRRVQDVNCPICGFHYFHHTEVIFADHGQVCIAFECEQCRDGGEYDAIRLVVKRRAGTTEMCWEATRRRVNYQLVTIPFQPEGV